MGLLVDQLSICFVLLITGVGSMIIIYSVGYMQHDRERRRFFGYMNLFLAAMLLLVLGDNYLVLYVGWEGVGLASYLLIGFWQYKSSAAVAAKKAFVVNRVGDAGLTLAIFLMFAEFGTVSFTGVGKPGRNWPGAGSHAARKSCPPWYSGSTTSSARSRPVTGARNDTPPAKSPNAGIPTAGIAGVSIFPLPSATSVCSAVSCCWPSLPGDLP